MSDTEMANGQTATAAAPSLNVLTQYINCLLYTSPSPRD